MPQKTRRSAAAAVLALGLAAYAALAWRAVRANSATYDEPIYITAGYTHLALRDFRVNPQTPPLAKMLAAAPLLALPAQFRRDDVAWRDGYQNKLARQFLYHWNDAERLLSWARLPIVLLACALAAAVFLWTLHQYGLSAAAVALVLCVLSPDVLAHGSLATTDLALALFVFLTIVAFERAGRGITVPAVLAAGAGLGAALATKVSAVALVPMLAVLAVVVALTSEALPLRIGRPRMLTTAPSRLLALFGVIAAMTLVAWAVLWAGHGFRAARSSDPAAPAFDWTILPDHGAAGAVLRGARDHHLLPESYLYGLAFRVTANDAGGDGAANAFLLGRVSETGWWYYFPVTFALKTPVPLLLMVAAALVLLPRRGPRRLDAFVWVPVVFYAGLMMSQHLNLGHRYLLPIYPFLFVAAGGAAAAAWHARPAWPKWALAVALAWYAAGTLRIQPHYLAYFNELAGGPSQGYRRLVDSSLDWGQDLKGLKAYLDRNAIGSVKLSYFGMADPEYYGIRCQRLPGFPPPAQIADVNPGDVVAVSATNLQALRMEQGRRLMRRLRESEPVDQVGYSILIYRPRFRWSPEEER